MSTCLKKAGNVRELSLENVVMKIAQKLC